jgi:hypothetical protein
VVHLQRYTPIPVSYAQAVESGTLKNFGVLCPVYVRNPNVGCYSSMDGVPHIDWTSSVLMMWAFLLVPWIPLAIGTNMTFEDGYTIRACVVMASVLTYPMMLALAAILRRKRRWLVFLPCINLAAVLLA